MGKGCLGYILPSPKPRLRLCMGLPDHCNVTCDRTMFDLCARLCFVPLGRNRHWQTFPVPAGGDTDVACSQVFRTTPERKHVHATRPGRFDSNNTGHSWHSKAVLSLIGQPLSNLFSFVAEYEDPRFRHHRPGDCASASGYERQQSHHREFDPSICLNAGASGHPMPVASRSGIGIFP